MQAGVRLIIILAVVMGWSACSPIPKRIADFSDDGGSLDGAGPDSGAQGTQTNAQGSQAGNSSNVNGTSGNGTPGSNNGAAASGGGTGAANGAAGTGSGVSGSGSPAGGAASGSTPPTAGTGSDPQAGGAANGGGATAGMSMAVGGTGATMGGTAGDGTMTPACVPTDEMCDGKDNDCDSKIDEEVPPMPCGNATTPCKQGAKVCTNGTWSSDCPGEVGPEKEICDGKDNDCNGVPDEGCDCTNGASEECGMSATSPCRKGTHTCVNGKWPSTCEGNVDPKTEVCDGVDNNCNSQKDEGKDALCSGGQHCGASGCVACTTAAHCATGNECKIGRCDASGTCSSTDAGSTTSCNSGRGKCGGGTCCTPSCSSNVCGGSDGCNGTCPDNCETSNRMCEGGVCVAKPVMKGEYDVCTASSNAQGDCGPNLICLNVGGSIPHCMGAPPCAAFSKESFGFCAKPCQGPQDASGGFVANPTGCPSNAPRCWEDALTEPLNDGLCIP
ncbi:MAG TPA: MopE-related protein [Polyangiales bacterium]|nr:MopE-related protein [Polyangiales bacterium]